MLSHAFTMMRFLIDSEKEASFTDFYHHTYLPSLLDEQPTLKTICHYEEYNPFGNIPGYHREFLTFFEFSSEVDMLKAQKDLEKVKAKGVFKEWKSWKRSALQKLTVCSFHRIYAHERSLTDTAFKPMPCYLVSVELQPKMEKKFNCWYEEEFLLKQMADVPSWISCTRYVTIHRKINRYLTFFEAETLAGLGDCLDLMRRTDRLVENATWNLWESGRSPPILWEDAACYRPVYRFPG